MIFRTFILLLTYTSFSQTVSDTTFVDIRDYAPEIIHDMKYATSDNFLKTPVYDCAKCYLRFKTAKSLAAAARQFAKKGLKIKLYDCYRPLSVQQKMWEIVPNPIYVADPKKGSIHNRGGAVDITLVDSEGNELDMGTTFDHFGPEAAHDYKNASPLVRSNRRLLKNTMRRAGFKHFESEWWHYNLDNASQFPVANFRWNCN